MKELPEPELTYILKNIEGIEDSASLIEFIGETAYWLDSNPPGKRKLVQPEAEA